MKATTYKRILGLFVFAFAFFVIGMPRVEASQECDNFRAEYEKKYNIKQRYLPNIDYDTSTGSALIYIDPNSFKGTNIKASEVKFKLVAMYGKTEGGNDVPLTLTQYVPKDGEPVNGVQKYKVSLYAAGKAKALVVQNLKGVYETYDTIKFKFEPDGYVDPAFRSGEGYQKCCSSEEYKKGKPCGITQIDAEYSVEYSGSQPGRGNVGRKPKNPDDPTPVITDPVDCDKGNYNVDSFEYKFCYAKKKAIAAKNVYNFTYTGKDAKKKYLTFAEKNDNKPRVFKCDKNVFVENNVDSEKYYMEKNTQYLYGYAERNVESGFVYKYNYAWNTDTETITCKLKCEEAVTVEYGPPIASAAGLCFGYKVRVTSRVVCNQGEAIKKPRDNYPVCTPYPKCVHSDGTVYDQGGPNDPFDKCVNKCDGGKYTDKCVTKCYKSVYGTSISASTMARKTFDTLSSASLKTVEDNKCLYEGKGYVANKTTGTITWDTNKAGQNRKYCFNNDPNNTKSVQSSQWYENGVNLFPFDPTWHRNPKNKWGKKYLSNGNLRYYNAYDKASGIPKRENCNDECSWQDCREDGIYLNEADAQKDMEENEKIYEEAKASCSLASTCTTTTSEYTIGASYKYAAGGKIQTKTVYFPYSKADTKDTIVNKDNKVEYCYNDKFNSWIPSVIGQDGCYACNQDNRTRHWYQTEWTFGHSWFRRKDGSVYFDKSKIPGDAAGYDFYPRRFCLPDNMQPVNSDWYYVYQKHMITINNENATFNNRELSASLRYVEYLIANGDKISSARLKEEYERLRSANLIYEGNVEYNIFAKTRKFGLFEWDIDMKCFFGTPKPEFTGCKDDPCCDGSCDKTSKKNMRIRIIDLANPFPDENGDTTVDNKAKDGIAHFNWTDYAKQTSKDLNYKSSPEAYKKWMINKNYAIYDDQYLDYEINLTKASINTIKGSGAKYTEFNGDYINDDVSSRSIYKSKFLRDTSLFGNNKLPQDAAIKCNNMKNYDSSECEDFEGGNN